MSEAQRVMSRLTKKANKASSAVLSQQVEGNLLVNDKNYLVKVLKACELSSDLQDSIWRLFQDNMEGWYRSTNVFEWDPVEKRVELFNHSSRFVLVTEQSVRNETSLIAYSMFRFDVEEDMNGNDEDVLYCYELQVSKEWRGHGLGKRLVYLLEALARQWSMKKVMLTVLKANTRAVRFYQREGFIVDALSPEDVGYLILVKVPCG